MACSNRPSHVLSEKKMEEVLYDLYIAEIEMRQNSQLFNNDSILKQQLLQSVFEGKKITEEEFDTSLVWYNKNLEKYVKINERLMARYDEEIEKLRKEQEAIEKKIEMQNELKLTVPMDTVYLFPARNFIFHSAYRENIFPFTVTDSEQLNENRRYYIDFLPIGITDSLCLVMSFNIQCYDTIYIHKDTIRSNELYSNSYYAPRKDKVQKVYGNIHLPENADHPIFIRKFSITQQKKRKETIE
ncbi:MAG: DUF4296 domain-containing protein [Dysgonamonadaceae bacterium]|nr:DUF4296 domain-containing protein [Dysgonamonadaceae bacterium]